MHMPGIGPIPRSRLTTERLLHRWSQKELADLIGTTSVNISRWERGFTRPGPYYRHKLCALFGKSEQELDVEASEEWVASKISIVQQNMQEPSSIADEKDTIATQEDKPHVKASSHALYDPLIPRRSALKLVGRTAELAQLQQRLCSGESVALTALNGLPGVGKTALSIALVQDKKIRAYFSDGILWAGLGPKPNKASMLSRWATLLNVPETEMVDATSNEARARAIRNALGTRRMLLVIDDAWTIEDALLFKAGGPDCAHLVTTRSPELATHFAPSGAVGIQELNEEDCIELLNVLAPSVVQSETPKIHTLVQAVGGLPLALTLIGNYLRKQARYKQPRRVQAALERLNSAEERLRLDEPQEPTDAHSSLDSDARLSLQSVFAVTELQLVQEARNVLYALSVFPAKPNTFSEEAALAVANCSIDMLDVLSDAGLLETSDNGRYTLHQTVADYARMQFKDSTAYDRLISYIATYVEVHEKDYDLLEQENALILTALEATHTTGTKTYFLRTVLAFTPYLLSRGLYAAAKQYLQRVYQAAQEQADTYHIIKTLLYLGRIAQKQGNYAEAEAHFKEGLTLARNVGDQEHTSALLNDLGWVTLKKGEYTQAETYLKEGLTFAQQIGHQDRISSLLEMLGSIAGSRGEYAQSEAYLQEGLTIARQIEDRERICTILINMGTTIAEQGRYVQAEKCFQEGLMIAYKIGHREWRSALLANLGGVEVELGNYPLAERYFQEGLLLARQIGQREWISALLLNLGLVIRKQKNYSQAKGYFDESLTLSREIGILQISANVLYEYGCLYMDLFQVEAAEEKFKEMLDTVSEESPDLVAQAQYGLARVAAAHGNIYRAQNIGGASLLALESMNHRDAEEVRRWLNTIEGK